MDTTVKFTQDQKVIIVETLEFQRHISFSEDGIDAPFDTAPIIPEATADREATAPQIGNADQSHDLIGFVN